MRPQHHSKLTRPLSAVNRELQHQSRFRPQPGQVALDRGDRRAYPGFASETSLAGCARFRRRNLDSGPRRFRRRNSRRQSADEERGEQQARSRRVRARGLCGQSATSTRFGATESGLAVCFRLDLLFLFTFCSRSPILPQETGFFSFSVNKGDSEMPALLTGETQMYLPAVPACVPPRPDGQPVSVACVRNWITRGISTPAGRGPSGGYPDRRAVGHVGSGGGSVRPDTDASGGARRSACVSPATRTASAGGYRRGCRQGKWPAGVTAPNRP